MAAIRGNSMGTVKMCMRSMDMCMMMPKLEQTCR